MTLIAINLAVFAVTFFFPDALYYLAMYVPFVFKGMVWTPITSIFTHSGIMHIAMNMFSLWFLGMVVEPVLGKGKFLILYMVSGLVGSAFSMGYDIMTHAEALYLGASGAIFGLFAAYGVMLIEAYRREKAVGRDASNAHSLKGSIVNFAVLLAVNVGFSMTPGIGWQAHLGGFIAGAIVSFIMLPPAKHTPPSPPDSPSEQQ